ncbi:MAG: uncharacterized protein QOG21_982 [Actinomycetota bacterium]|nr:uncharacterized protein [Actinomycetota bacterium]
MISGDGGFRRGSQPASHKRKVKVPAERGGHNEDHPHEAPDSGDDLGDDWGRPGGCIEEHRPHGSHHDRLEAMEPGPRSGALEERDKPADRKQYVRQGSHRHSLGAQPGVALGNHGAMSNRLAHETSPYLLQHKDNPVDWFAWGPEALERSRAEQKPILLSVGYAACHWCHVMAHESFEDPEVARLINEHFIAVKVDREERPDIDAVYMTAVQAMTGQGGWPMTVFLTPDGEPFYGGTYFPPEDRHGLPSFQRLLLAINEIWQERRGDAMDQAKQLMKHIDASADFAVPDDPLTPDILDAAAISIARSLDTVYGGFGGAPKFPQAPVLDLLLRLEQRGANTQGPLTLTLDRMAAGGIFDQLGGGFHRYSVDRQWVVPHFEKMLYDNAQLLRTYARAWQRFGSARYREVTESTGEWLLREMRDPAGGFWSSLDADSEGVEGQFYLWTLDEVREVAGADAGAAIARWGFTDAGNFEGQNIAVLVKPGGDGPAIERAQAALLQRRAERTRPGTDNKVITSWNALTASALAEAGTALSLPHWVRAARECMDFVLSKLCVDGRLMRSYRDGAVKHLGYAEDYAFTLEACLSLYEASFEPRWLQSARRVADSAVELFADARGGFFSTGSDAEVLVTRPKDIMDSPVPSSNSVLALELQRLSLIFQKPGYEDAALGPMKSMRSAMQQAPTGFAHLLSALDFYTSSPPEIVIIGPAGDTGTDELVRVAQESFRPNKVLLRAEPGAELASSVPLLQDRPMVEGKATAYVCRHGACKQPVDSAGALLAELSL